MNLIEKVQGRWKVTINRGEVENNPAFRLMLHLLNLLEDEKEITGYLGHNIIGENEWGWFVVEFDPEHITERLLLNYNDPRNSKILRKVHDVLEKDGEGWTGTFYYNNKKIFTFRLDREENKQ